jgi:GTPase
MGIPQVVIVGRPNVGKSSIFNWLSGRRLSIVDDHAGVTRDRVTYLMENEGRYFELVDTGGMGLTDDDDLTDEVEEQIEAAVESADIILFVLDTRTGIAPLDAEVSKRLRYVDKPIICVANKTDAPTLEPQADEFYRLARGQLVKVSAKENRGKSELMDLIAERLPVKIEDAPVDPVMKVAIVGRRNVGKSTFVNTLARAERMIVSEVPGTTRDSVDVRFELDGKTFTAIDTPGLKRMRAVKTDIDFYSTHRAQRSIRRADVVLLFFDAGQQISKVDKQLCKYIADNFKPCIFVVNKWDQMVGHMPTDRWVQYLRDTFRSMWHVPIAFITGQTGKNVKALLNHSQMLFKQSLDRVGTGELNRLVKQTLTIHPPPMHGSITPKIYYSTQVSTQPPTIVLVCNEPRAFAPTYRRYLLNAMRDALSFGEVPLKLYLKKRRREDTRDEIRNYDKEGRGDAIDHDETIFPDSNAESTHADSQSNYDHDSDMYDEFDSADDEQFEITDDEG